MEIALLIYVIGFVVMFAVLSIYAFTIAKNDIFQEVELGPILGYSLVWPLTLLFIAIGVMFG
jgi:4-amino-4-deoxy-L-arabinose transferase-like glycosyltransferase